MAKWLAGHTAVMAKWLAGHTAVMAKWLAGHTAVMAKWLAGHTAVMAKWLAGQTAMLTARVRVPHECMFPVQCKVITLPAFYDAITGQTKFISIVNSVKNG